MFSKYPSVFGCLYLPLCSPIIDSSHLNCPCGSSKITIHTGGKSPLIYNCLTIDHYYITIWKKWIYSLILSISNNKPHHSFMRPRRPQLWPHVPGVFFMRQTFFNILSEVWEPKNFQSFWCLLFFHILDFSWFWDFFQRTCWAYERFPRVFSPVFVKTSLSRPGLYVNGFDEEHRRVRGGRWGCRSRLRERLGHVQGMSPLVLWLRTRLYPHGMDGM